jgi:microcystin-dependent protein
LLTTAPQQFFDSNGEPLALGTVTVYVAGTTVLATTYQDPLLSIPNTNPINLSSGGSCTIWGLGNYTLVSQDSAGNQIASQEVSGGISSLTLELSGTANTYTITVPGLVTTGLANPLGQLSGIILLLVANVTNTGASVVNLNGFGNVQIQYPNTSSLVGGELPAGAYVPVIYNPGLNVLQLLTASTTTGSSIPGEIRAYGGSTAPAGWGLCYGQAVSRATYPSTFAALGVAWGAGNGTTTFNLPDLRGRALFGVDAMGGAAANRITSNSLGGTGITGELFAVMGNPVTVSGVTTYSIVNVGISNPGQGYTSVPAITINAAYGTGGSITASVLNGVVNGYTLNNGGGGYPANVTLTCAAPSSSTTAILGATGGSENVQQHSHSISITDSGHNHATNGTALGGSGGSGSGGSVSAGTSYMTENGTYVAVNETGITATAANYGTGGSQNLPPAAIVNWIIALS